MEAKLRFSQRVVLLAGALLLILIGAAILAGSLQFNEIPIRREGEGFFTITRLVLVVAGGLTILLGFYLLTLPHKMKEGRNSFVVQQTDSGEMRISVQAVESIVQKCLSQHEEIKLQSLQVSNARGGVIVSLKADLAGNINIPLAVSALQKHIRQHLSATAGIDAKEVRILVQSAESTVGVSPYLVKPEELSLPRNAAQGESTAPPDGKQNKKEG